MISHTHPSHPHPTIYRVCHISYPLLTPPHPQHIPVMSYHIPTPHPQHIPGMSYHIPTPHSRPHTPLPPPHQTYTGYVISYTHPSPPTYTGYVISYTHPSLPPPHPTPAPTSNIYRVCHIIYPPLTPNIYRVCHIIYPPLTPHSRPHTPHQTYTGYVISYTHPSHPTPQIYINKIYINVYYYSMYIM